MTTPRQPHPTSTTGELSDVSTDDLLVGELTAALFESQRTADDALPPALAQRITLTGEALVRTTRGNATSSATASASASASSSGSDTVPSIGRPARSPLAWSGWLAAAALLGVMVMRGQPDAAPTAPSPAATSPSPIAGLPAAALEQDVRLLRATLLTDSLLVRVPWTPTTDSTGRTVEGEVLWSPTMQRGVMRITGLMPNDTTAWQYQLWIFDKTRDQRYPVDGGVFDIRAGQVDLLVPIRARIPVGDAVMFAVTVEKPGGVVVSSRERIAMLAKL